MARRSGLIERADRLRRLPSEDRRRFAAALLMIAATRLALAVTSYPRARAAMLGLARRPAGALDPTPGTSERIGWAVSSASRFVPGATCLPQALATELLLRRAGHDAVVHLGVGRDPAGAIEAHAWVESHGRVVVGEQEIERFTPLVRADASVPDLLGG